MYFKALFQTKIPSILGGMWISAALEPDYPFHCKKKIKFLLIILVISNMYVLHSGYSHLAPHHYLPPQTNPINTHFSLELFLTSTPV